MTENIYNPIEPRTKTQQKQFERLKTHLGITLPEEEFVLKAILSFDWNRQAIIQSIVKIEKEKHLDLIRFEVNMVQPCMTVDYTCSNPFRETGWTLGVNTFYERASYVHRQLSKYCCQR